MATFNRVADPWFWSIGDSDNSFTDRIYPLPLSDVPPPGSGVSYCGSNVRGVHFYGTGKGVQHNQYRWEFQGRR